MRLSFSARLCNRCCKRLVRGLTGYHSSIHGYRLVEEGKLEIPHGSSELYETGKHFLHKVFAYRGMVMYSWKAHVYDRDIYTNDTLESVENLEFEQIKGLTHEVKLYYTTLMDKRDIHCVRTFPQLLILLDNGAPCTLPGLDYVSHEDVVPYTKTSKEPFDSGLLLHPASHSQDSKSWREISNEVTNVWRELTTRWLNLRQVHCQTTNGVKVTVIPFYIGKDPDKGKSYWGYSILLQSMIQDQFQLVERHWKICHGSGELHTVRGHGVVGQEPKFSSIQPAFQYSSHVALDSPTGHMWGTFIMRKSDKTFFEVRVPPFYLESP